jgi:hypothetical protein
MKPACPLRHGKRPRFLTPKARAACARRAGDALQCQKSGRCRGMARRFHMAIVILILVLIAYFQAPCTTIACVIFFLIFGLPALLKSKR